ncbi:hypothetical protein GH714_012197 [Hevea brasiliensis]|uniref:Calcium uniporter protein C-terminal domain-containing protein n=1 Tax=Hevea brasiliensis TaxID=3981 RepID=A0A6A6K4A9_HEVBR|nr:hypothetical protein GH714_012197 [Hevea brasiliensis]
MEMVKSRLREMENSWITYPEFVRICGEGYSDPEQGIRVAKRLDESGTVIVLGSACSSSQNRREQKGISVFMSFPLLPILKLLAFSGSISSVLFFVLSVFEESSTVVKAIGGLIPFPATSPNDPRRKELEHMEKQKAAIDNKANTLVRRELWCGLGYLVVQTAAFMRLTFWELSWDVMEPICFYVTSIHCMAGYAFFLRTSKEPSFEGFYQSRFNVKQKKLMKLHNFNAERYNELRKICYPSSASSGQMPAISSLDQADKA